MSEPDSLSRPVLCTGAAEKVKNPLVILGVDAPAVVGDLENGKTELGPAADSNVAGNSGFQVFQRIVDQIGENLFQRQAVADDLR
jgi:hypothetical protein